MQHRTIVFSNVHIIFIFIAAVMKPKIVYTLRLIGKCNRNHCTKYPVETYIHFLNTGNPTYSHFAPKFSVVKCRFYKQVFYREWVKKLPQFHFLLSRLSRRYDIKIFPFFSPIKLIYFCTCPCQKQFRVFKTCNGPH